MNELIAKREGLKKELQDLDRQGWFRAAFKVRVLLYENSKAIARLQRA